MRKILGIVCVVLALFMVPVAQATTINFDSLVHVDGTATNSFQGNSLNTVQAGEPYRMHQGNSSPVDWTQEQGVDGNDTMAIFNHLTTVVDNTSSRMETWIPALGTGGFISQKDAEFTFEGVDIYHDNAAASFQIDINGAESRTGPNVFGLSVVIPQGTGWFHYDLDPNSIEINTKIGALFFSAGHVTGTPGFTMGFDNLRVCQGILAPCLYDTTMNFNQIVPSGLPPGYPNVTPTVNGGTLPEPSTWWYLILAAGTILVVRKFAYV